MPSKNMLPKGQRHRSVRKEYVATRGVEPAAAPLIPTLALDPYAPGAASVTHRIITPPEARGLRLDQYLAQAIPEISRSRVQLLIEHGQILVNGSPARPKHKLTPGETITLAGSPQPEPLHATAQAIPLDIVFEDDFLAIINKPAGMNVHAGVAAPKPASSDTHPDDSEASQDPRSSGTLVNALLHHFAGKLSSVGGALRPGIVHRLDKQTSGLLLVAKDDRTHSRLAEAFAERSVSKTYLALVHGHLRLDDTTVRLPIGRDLIRRTRMTFRRPADAPGVRPAVSHLHVLERLLTPFGPFTLVEVSIETGRTHQIRVHLQALGHPVVGDTTYGAAATLHLSESSSARSSARPAPLPSTSTAGTLTLGRNFLHAARLALIHPRTGQPLHAEAPLPPELTSFLADLRASPPETPETR